MSKVYRVFVSSVGGGLEECRESARKIVNQLDWAKFVGMEDFGAQSKDPMDTCLEAVSNCDIFVAILGPRYGSKSKSGISISELEFDHAREKGLHRLLFLTTESFPFRSDLSDNKRDKIKQEKFRIKASSQLTRAYFNCVEDLRVNLAMALWSAYDALIDKGVETSSQASITLRTSLVLTPAYRSPTHLPSHLVVLLRKGKSCFTISAILPAGDPLRTLKDLFQSHRDNPWFLR